MRVRTAQFRAYRRPPNCRRRHAAWAGDGSSAKQNACALHPSGIANPATVTPRRPSQEPPGPVAGRRVGGVPFPADPRPHLLSGQLASQLPRFLLGPPDLRRPSRVDRGSLDTGRRGGPPPLLTQSGAGDAKLPGSTLQFTPLRLSHHAPPGHHAAILPPAYDSSGAGTARGPLWPGAAQRLQRPVPGQAAAMQAGAEPGEHLRRLADQGRHAGINFQVLSSTLLVGYDICRNCTRVQRDRCPWPERAPWACRGRWYREDISSQQDADPGAGPACAGPDRGLDPHHRAGGTSRPPGEPGDLPARVSLLAVRGQPRMRPIRPGCGSGGGHQHRTLAHPGPRRAAAFPHETTRTH